jgi:hypothetical protein
MHPGDHACVIYSSDSELIAIVATYLQEGLRGGERCWYAASAASELSQVRTALEAKGVAVADAEERRSLLLATSQEVYLADGTFNPERTLQNLTDAIPTAIDDGFTALRVAGEMSWTLERKPGTDRVIEYEDGVEMVLRASTALALCLYHRRDIPAVLLEGALTKHPLAGVSGRPQPNAFFRPKAIADLRTPQVDDISWNLNHLQRRRH